MDNNNDDEERFMRIFSKQLAEALRAKDEEEAEDRERLRSGKGRLGSGAANANEPNKQWERIRVTYSELCHDDPIISGGDGDCRLLAKALIPKQKQYATGKKDTNINQQLALSSRLVEGILQATSRAQEKAAVVSTTSQTNNNDKKNNVENKEQESSSSMFSPSSITSAEGLAEIAFSIFAEGPYRCIQQDDNLRSVSTFLGSFQPPDTTINNQISLSAEEKAQLVDEATARIVDGMEKMAMEGGEDGDSTQTAAADDDKSANNRKDNDDDASSSSSEFFHHNKTQGEPQSRAADDNDSLLQEVFADESDADDYEYESSYNPYSATNDVQPIFGQNTTAAAASGTEDEYDVADDSDFGFNPLQLSEPNATNQTWEGARKAIHYLLSSLTYGKLALSSLSSRTWSEGGMSETLADLSFMLLLENAKREDGGDNAAATEPVSLLHSTHHERDLEGDILALWNRPLFILRDRALDKNHGHDALPAYLQLLTAFLSHTEQDVMSILSSPLSKNKSSPAQNVVLPPATTVGLSSLAAMCTSNEMTDASSGKMCGTSVWSVCPREEMKKAIVSSIGSLSRIVECFRPKKKSPFAKRVAEEEGESFNKIDSPWLRTAICIIPIIEYLTNLQARFDFQPLFEGGGSRSSATTLSDSDAKTISDSGLFRELLSMYTATSRESDTSNNATEKPKAEEVARMQLLRTLFTLSTQSPELLGRYAVRVPDFAKEVHSSAFMDENLVDGILWTSVGSSLLENKTDAAPKPKLKLRANSKLKTKAPIEEKSLAERSIAGFETICHSSKVALRMLEECLHKAEKHTMGVEEKIEYEACKYALGDIRRFSNCLSNCPSATTLWLNSLKNRDDSTQKATASIAELKATLASLPSFRDEIKEAPHRSHKKDDDDNDNEGDEDEAVPEDVPIQKTQTLKQMRKEYGTIVASIRSSVKIIALAVESQKGTGLSLKKGPVSYNMSSKTD